MSDPRIGGGHLSIGRHDQYDAAIDDMLDARGPLTGAADPLVRAPSLQQPVRRGPVPPGGTYTLINVATAKRHELRVGINTIGRFPENDIHLEPNGVSRRHCVVLVHATGRCEVHDTASRNGTWLNGRRVAQSDLFPGDMLMLVDQKFLLAWVGPNGEVFESTASDETNVGGLSPSDTMIGTPL